MALVTLPVSGPSLSQSEIHPLQPSGSIQHRMWHFFCWETILHLFKKLFTRYLCIGALSSLKDNYGIAHQKSFIRPVVP